MSITSEKRRDYLFLCKRLKRIKRFVSRLDSKDWRAISELLNRRRQLAQVFVQPCIQQVCRNCGGKCCIDTRAASHLTFFKDLEFLYLTALGFDFPEPDWKFISSHLKNGNSSICMFLTAGGCALKENRPETCLSYTCYSLLEAFGKEKNLKSELNLKQEEFNDLFRAYRISIWGIVGDKISLF